MNPKETPQNDNELILDAVMDQNAKLDSLNELNEVQAQGSVETNTQLEELNRTADMMLQKMAEEPEVRKVQIMGAEVITIKGEKGDKPIFGVDFFLEEDRKAMMDEILGKATPKYGTDYMTEKDIGEFIKKVTPVKGVDYFTPEELENIKKSVTPVKGKDYQDGESIDEERIKELIASQIPEIKDGYTPKKGVDYFDGEPGERGSPDTPDEVKAKLLKVGIQYDEISGLPNIPSIVYGILAGRDTSSKTVSITELDDVDLSGLTLVNGKYVLSSGGTPGGSDTQVQFNDGGSFGGDAGLTYDKTNKQLTISKSGIGATQSDSYGLHLNGDTNSVGFYASPPLIMSASYNVGTQYFRWRAYTSNFGSYILDFSDSGSSYLTYFSINGLGRIDTGVWNATAIGAQYGGTGLNTSASTGVPIISSGTWSVTTDLAFSNLAQGSALSVLGVTGNAAADVASIAAGTDHQVLRRSGTSLTFGAVNLAQSAAVTGLLPFANIADGSALSVLGRSANSSGVMASIAAGTDGNVLRRSGTTLGFGGINPTTVGSWASLTANRVYWANSGGTAFTSSSGFAMNSAGSLLTTPNIQVVAAGIPQAYYGNVTVISSTQSSFAFRNSNDQAHIFGHDLSDNGGHNFFIYNHDPLAFDRTVMVINDQNNATFGGELTNSSKLWVAGFEGIADSCSGTPSDTDCSTSGDEGSCLARSGCSWNGSSCEGTADCSYGNQGDCEGAGCSWGGGAPASASMFRVSYDPNNTEYWDVYIDSSGNATFDLAGSSPSFIFSDPVNITSSLQCDSIVNDTGLASGTYTPTLTNTTNIGASTARLATYMRVGNTVTVAGQVDIDPTATGAVLLGISLPIASDFSTAFQAGGTISAKAFVEAGMIEADATNNRVSANFIAVDTTNHTFGYTFTYQVI